MNRTIAHVTDIHLDEQFSNDLGIDARKNWKKILNDISEKGIEHIIIGGDIGETTANAWFFNSLQDYKIDITLGNHDDFNEVIKHYNFESTTKQNELYYTREYDEFKCIFLDASSESIGKEQLDWFRKELITSKNILLFIHYPILAVETKVDDQFHLKKRNEIKRELLNIHNEITIFCGHYHVEDDTIDTNIRQYITPASSYQVEKLPNEIKINATTFGYRIIELSKATISTEVVYFM